MPQRFTSHSVDVLTIRVLALYDNSKLSWLACVCVEYSQRTPERKIKIVLYALLIFEAVAKTATGIFNSLAKGGRVIYEKLSSPLSHNQQSCPYRPWEEYYGMWSIKLSSGVSLCA